MYKRLQQLAFIALAWLACAPIAAAACRDAVVLVHGNTSSPASWDNTYVELRARGLADNEIIRPGWGSSCAACNDHNGSEETPVLDALIDAIAVSCTGKVDVIGHSMGATLAAKQIMDNGLAGYVDAFIGVAGAFRGLRSCGTYPYNIPNSTCGYWGLSMYSPFLNDLYGDRFGARVYSIKSYYDQVVCSTGYCTVGWIHSSSIWDEDASYTYNAYGHFGLQTYTAATQANLIE
jgi:pimeloyl-ACP methyl ester carboxylesterase